MIVTAVESATVKSIGYDESRALLRLEFRSGAVYDYFQVPSTVHETLLCAPSIGASFNQVVRGSFAYRRVGRVDSACVPKGGR